MSGIQRNIAAAAAATCMSLVLILPSAASSLTQQAHAISAAAPPANPDQQGISGAWANYGTDGQGLLIEVSPDLLGSGAGLLFAGWYTYATGTSAPKRWYTLQGMASQATASANADIYRTTGGRFDSLQATSTIKVGTATIEFVSCSQATMTFNFSDGSGRSGVIPLARMLSNINCGQQGNTGAASGGYLHSGAWADVAANSGQGLVLEANPAMSTLFGGWYTFAAMSSPDAGETGLTWYTVQAAMAADGSVPGSFGIYETTGGTFNGSAAVSTVQVGTASITFHDCTHATLGYAFTQGQNAGRDGALELVRLAPAPVGCQ